MIILMLRLLTGVVIAFFMGKLVSKVKLPAILGWLITGMIVGPHGMGIVSSKLLSASWYRTILLILECSMGLMIGTELVFKELKKTGKQIILTTISQSFGTFFVVTLFFGIIFYLRGGPLYVSLIMGGIALATAPAPAISIVKEFKTDGPVTRTLIPMAALDDIVAILVFFSITTFITAANAEKSTPLYLTLAMMILLPIAIGVVVGLLGGIVLKKEKSKKMTLITTVLLILLVSSVGIVFNNFILEQPVLNFMLIGMAFAATFANMVSQERLSQIMDSFSPILEISLLMVILNLGAPLDYNLILGAGTFTVIYIISRALGKYTGAFLGAKITGLPKTVQKYLGLTLLPHSGVSLVFTGIAVTSLNTFDPSSAVIIQGTIAAAAVINEVIAVIIAKKAFEWSGELDKKDQLNITNEQVIYD